MGTTSALSYLGNYCIVELGKGQRGDFWDYFLYNLDRRGRGDTKR